jgi:hypothetical protein
MEEVDDGALRSHSVGGRFLFAYMVDIEQHDSSDSKRDSIGLDSDEEVHNEVHTKMWWPRKRPQYVYDAVAERTAQHLRERKRPPDIVSTALDTVGATSSLAAIPMHPPVEQKASASFVSVE